MHEIISKLEKILPCFECKYFFIHPVHKTPLIGIDVEHKEVFWICNNKAFQERLRKEYGLNILDNRMCISLEEIEKGVKLKCEGFIKRDE